MARTSNQLACYLATVHLALALVSLLTVGCAAPWLESYDHEQSIHCRIDNSDRDSLWDTSDTNGNGLIDDNETAGVTFDLARLPRGKNFSFFTSYTETYSMQLSRSHRFTKEGTENSSHDNPFFEVAYGTRYHRLRESFGFDAYDGVIGRLAFDATYDNELLGPQLEFNLGNQFFGWDLQLGSTLMLGYNLATANQFGQIGENLVSGALNRPLYATPNVFANEQENNDIASIAEIRAQAAYDLSPSSTFRFGYTSLYFSHLRHVDTSIAWSLPDFGINSHVTRDTFISGLHASVEWRR